MSLWPYPPKRVFTETLDEAHAREKAAEDRRQRRVAEFEELKAWAEDLPELVVRLSPGECHFASVYQPYPSMDGRPGVHYGMAVPFKAVMEAVRDAPLEAPGLARLDDEVCTRVQVKPATEHCPFDYVGLRGKWRPEVYVPAHSFGCQPENHHEALDRLMRAREVLSARNLPAHRLFLDRAVTVHVRVSAWWTNRDGRPVYGRMDRIGLALSPVRVGVRV